MPSLVNEPAVDECTNFNSQPSLQKAELAINDLLARITDDSPAYLTDSTESLITTSTTNQTIHRPNERRPPISYLLPPMTVLFPRGAQKQFRYLSKEHLKFLWFREFTNLLVNVNDARHAQEEMFSECRRHYETQSVELSKIDAFERIYTKFHAIQYYTMDSFLFRLVNSAFRSEDPEQIFNISLLQYVIFINKLTEVSQLQSEHIDLEDVTLYRGKKLEANVLQQLKDNINGLVSINGFLSTSQSKAVAEIYAGVDEESDGYISALFELHVNKASLLRKFALISEFSQFPQEKEVLFTVGNVWKIESVSYAQERHMWTVCLKTYSLTDSAASDLLNEISPIQKGFDVS